MDMGSVSVAGMNNLKSILMGDKMNVPSSKSNKKGELEVIESRMNDQFLDENFVEDEREYEYHSWNHTTNYSKVNF